MFLHILSVVTILSSYFVASFVRTLVSSQNSENLKQSNLQSPPEGQNVVDTAESIDVSSKWKRRLQMALMAIIALLCACEAGILAAFSHQTNSANEDVVFALFSCLVWSILILSYSETKFLKETNDFRFPWIAAAFFETLLLIANANDSLQYPKTIHIGHLVLEEIRLLIITCLLGSEYLCSLSKHSTIQDEEVVPLLLEVEDTQTGKSIHQEDTNAHKVDDNETKDDEDDEDDDEDDDEEGYIRKFQQNWISYLKAFKVFLPFVWPDTMIAKLSLGGLGICIIINRILNIVLPLSLGWIINNWETLGGLPMKMPWGLICVYILLRLLVSGAGMPTLQNMLWMPLEQRATFRIKTAAYDHVMNLSYDYHSSKSHSGVWQTVYRGQDVVYLVQRVGIHLLPMIADLVLSISVFWVLFNAYMAFIVAVVVFIFFWATAKSLALKTAYQRKVNKTWEDEWLQSWQSSTSWETVSQFGRIPYEELRFKEIVANGQKVRFRNRMVNNLFDGIRDVTLLSGLLMGSFLAAYQITYGGAKVGSFVVLISYWAQMESPLSDLASTINDVARQLVDAEKLMILLNTKATVQETADANDFVLKHGEVEFKPDKDGKGVSFSYDGERHVTKDVAFHVRPGQTVALVGETGCGKSTLFRLLFRFYDIAAGHILIDGQDISTLTLDSFRSHIGVVPQEPVLFNASILENLRYARLDANDDEIYEACKAVALHEKILSFTKGYNSKVGERGVKLSGGEKQRIAIARVILKNPKILLLDEATSSVDSITEAQIQASLSKLCTDRTTFVIAHRLSTIVHADQVFVMSNGSIVETGKHSDMIRRKGPYNKLWTSQLKIDSVDGKEEGSRSRSITRQGASLINDLDMHDDESKDLIQQTGWDTQSTNQETKRGRSLTRSVIEGTRRRFSRSSRAGREIEIGSACSHESDALKTDTTESVSPSLPGAHQTLTNDLTIENSTKGRG